jgi:hypothetical protein
VSAQARYFATAFDSGPRPALLKRFARWHFSGGTESSEPACPSE